MYVVDNIFMVFTSQERLKKIKGWTCNHNGREVRIGSVTGETIHRFVINVNRNTSSVRGEIVELERLIKGEAFSGVS